MSRPCPRCCAIQALTPDRSMLHNLHSSESTPAAAPPGCAMSPHGLVNG